MNEPALTNYFDYFLLGSWCWRSKRAKGVEGTAQMQGLQVVSGQCHPRKVRAGRGRQSVWSGLAGFSPIDSFFWWGIDFLGSKRARPILLGHSATTREQGQCVAWRLGLSAGRQLIPGLLYCLTWMCELLSGQGTIFLTGAHQGIFSCNRVLCPLSALLV